MANKAIHELVDTWNNGGTTFNAIYMDVTNSASAAESRLIRLDVGGAEKFGVRKDGAAFFASGAKLDFASGDVTVTHASNTLTFAGASSGYQFGGGPVVPSTNNGAALGTTALQWSDIFLASGAVINLANGDVTITHSANALAFAGAASGYTFDDDVLAVGDILTSAGNRKAAVASTSGTSIDFTGIPSNVRRITINFAGVSTGGTSMPIVQLGDSGGVETTGYLGASTVISGATPSTSNETNGFRFGGGAAANVMHGSITLSLLDSVTNTWAASGVIGLSNGTTTILVGGSKPLSATLDRVRLTTAGGSDTFDAGLIGLIYD